MTASITSGQEQQLVRLFEDGGHWAIGIVEGKHNLTTDQWQRVLERGNELRASWPGLLVNLAQGRYADEKIKSDYGYHFGGKKPLAASDQIDILRSHWPNLKPDPALRFAREVYPQRELPSWVEGPFAIVRPDFFSAVYGEEVKEVLKVLAKARGGKLYNYREGKLGPNYLRQSEKTLRCIHQLMERQPDSDILISAAQFGLHHRGRSVRRAREVMSANEFGLGAFHVGIMLLTHPERLQHHDDLWIDCAGDEYMPDGDVVFSRAPCFGFGGDRVWFGMGYVGNARDGCGSSSAFLSQN